MYGNLLLSWSGVVRGGESDAADPGKMIVEI